MKFYSLKLFKLNIIKSRVQKNYFDIEKKNYRYNYAKYKLNVKLKIKCTIVIFVITDKRYIN